MGKGGRRSGSEALVLGLEHVDDISEFGLVGLVELDERLMGGEAEKLNIS